MSRQRASNEVAGEKAQATEGEATTRVNLRASPASFILLSYLIFPSLYAARCGAARWLPSSTAIVVTISSRTLCSTGEDLTSRDEFPRETSQPSIVNGTFNAERDYFSPSPFTFSLSLSLSFSLSLPLSFFSPLSFSRGEIKILRRAACALAGFST